MKQSEIACSLNVAGTGWKPVSRGRLFKRLALAVVILIVVSIGMFNAAVWWWPYPATAERPPAAATWIVDRQGVPLAAFAAVNGDWCLPLRQDEISPHLLDAIVAVEDQRFYQHGGVDWQSAVGAGWQDLKSCSFHRGASTLTMQLQHLREPVPRSVIAKIAQAIRACQIQHRMSRQDILVEYLNRAPFGGNLVGAGAASWRYFGRKCADLSLGQAALLAGLPQSPNRFRPDRFPLAARARRDHVLDRMLAAGMITAHQRQEAGNEPVDAAWRPLPQDAEDVALLPTMTRLARLTPGRTINTTIDLATQKQAARAAADQLTLLQSSNVTAAAVVVLDTQTGECLAAVSRSRQSSTNAEQVDLTMCPRSSGSALKPLIYAAAFDAGICTPRTMLDDSPASWAGYEPENYDRRFDGLLPAGEALALSRNVPALYVLSKVGVARAVEVMRACGLATLARTPDRYGLSLAIGGAEVTPMELAAAYATLARGGREMQNGECDSTAFGSEAHARRELAEVRMQNEEASSFITHHSSLIISSHILRPSSCLQVLQCIADPERTRRVCPGAVELAPAWKTGTSSGHRDAWCAAVTPRRTVVVWMGNADGSGSDALVGQDAAAPLALRILAAVDVHRITTEVAGFAPPPGFLSGAKVDLSRQLQSNLSLVSPADHQEILRDSSLPSDRQRFAMQAREAGSSEVAALWWFVDGQCIGSCSSGDRLWWDPVVGSHEVRVVDAAGRAAMAKIWVR